MSLATLAPTARSENTPRRGATWVAHELLLRQRTLAWFGAALMLLALPTALAWGLDDRMLRGVNVWIKPMKFMLSVGLLSLTTAWFIGHLPHEQRRTRAVKAIVAMVVGAGTFEVAYITVQAALGQASHYNHIDAFHSAMFALMGVGAIVLTGSQPLLAWLLARHPDAAIAPAYRHAVIVGLVLTFVLGAGVGNVLSQMQPPDAAGLPLLGWSFAGGDLRPAHFMGIHAAQFIPAAGLAMAAWRVPRGERWVWLLSLTYSAACLLLALQAFSGRAVY